VKVEQQLVIVFVTPDIGINFQKKDFLGVIAR